MSGLPSVHCPCCNVQLPLEGWIAHAATREAFLALAALHPSVRLPMTAHIRNQRKSFTHQETPHD